jgi:hypothetical protein
VTSKNPRGRVRKGSDDPSLIAETYQSALATQTRLGKTLPWRTPQELAEFLGPRPEGAHLSRHSKVLGHGPGNTCWSTTLDTAEKRTYRKALLKGFKAPYRAFNSNTNTDPLPSGKNAYEAREQNPKTKGLTARIDRLQVRLLKDELKKVRTPLRTLSEFAEENGLPVRYFNGRFNRQDAPKPVFKGQFALPELTLWLKTLQSE